MRLSEWLNRPRLQQLALLAAGIAIAAMLLQMLGAHGLVLANGLPVFGDFLAFWSAGKLALHGQAADVYSVAAIAPVQNAEFPGLNLVFPWRHAPMFLFVATPLAALPFPVAALTFLAFTAALYLFAVRKAAPDPRDILFAATMPTVIMHVGSVQVGLLITGLTILALHWRDRRPLAAGACIGLLAIKPHLALLWPIFLAAQGRWRTFASAALVSVAFTLLAGAVFGFDLFTRFVEAMAEGLRSVDEGRAPTDTLASLHANLLGLGFPASLALTLHALSAFAAGGVAIETWRRGRDEDASIAAFAAATLLMSPYLFFYDQTLLIIGVGALYRRATLREGVWLCFAWSAGALSLAIGKLASLPICPLAAWAVLVIAAKRVQLFSRRQAS